MFQFIQAIYDGENDCIHVLEDGKVKTYYNETSVALFTWEAPDGFTDFTNDFFEEMSSEEFNKIFGS